MALGPGYKDARGIWRYGEDDTNPLASDLLNRGQESVSDALKYFAGTPAERAALTPAPTGARWKDTDAAGGEWVGVGGDWVLDRLTLTSFIAPSTSPALTVVRPKLVIIGDDALATFAISGSIVTNMFIGYITPTDYRPNGTDLYPVAAAGVTPPQAAHIRIRGRSDTLPGEMWYWGPSCAAFHANFPYRWR